MTAAPWTTAQDTILRERYVRDGATACAHALGRSFASVTRRAQCLGLRRVPRWTPKEDGRLQVLWGIHPLPKIAEELGRTPEGVYWRARVIGLGLGCPQGFEYLSDAAVRTGYHVKSLRKILIWAHVHIFRSASRKRRPTGPGGHWIVEPLDVDEAVQQWLATEALECAARRYGVCSRVLARLLDEAIARGDTRVPARPRFKRHWRIPTVLVNELLDTYLAKETLRSAAARVGVTDVTLRAWLRDAGVTYSKKDGVPTTEVDRIVAEKREAGCRAWQPRRAA